MNQIKAIHETLSTQVCLPSVEEEEFGSKTVKLTPCKIISVLYLSLPSNRINWNYNSLD